MNIIGIILIVVMVCFFVKQVVDLVKAIKERVARKKLEEQVKHDNVIEVEDFNVK